MTFMYLSGGAAAGAGDSMATEAPVVITGKQNSIPGQRTQPKNNNTRGTSEEARHGRTTSKYQYLP